VFDSEDPVVEFTLTGVFANIKHGEITVSYEDIVLLEGAIVTGTLTATNMSSQWTNYPEGSVDAFMFDGFGQLIGYAEKSFELVLEPLASDTQNKACFQFSLDNLIQL
jgi:hypothetical protein